jgi:hypothetical protein
MTCIASPVAGDADKLYPFKDVSLYHQDGAISLPRWHIRDGRVAKVLGITDGSEVIRDHYCRLFDGHHPKEPRQKLVQNAGKKDRIAAYDWTFGSGKGVSVLWAGADIERRRAIETVHKNAVKLAVEYLSTHMKTRLGGDNAREIHHAEIVLAGFTHRDSRPVEIEITPEEQAIYNLPLSENGQPAIVAPFLHEHLMMLNVAFTAGPDGQLKTTAIDTNQIYEHQRVAANLYSGAMAIGMRKVFGPGLDVEIDDQGNFDVTAIPSDIRGKFSPRSSQIETEIAHLEGGGQTITSRAAVKRFANLRTRLAKINPDDLDFDANLVAQDMLNGFGDLDRKAILDEAKTRAPELCKKWPPLNLDGIADELLENRPYVKRSDIFERVTRRYAQSGGSMDLEAMTRSVDQVIKDQFLVAPRLDMHQRGIFSSEKILRAEVNAARGAEALALDKTHSFSHEIAQQVVAKAEANAAERWRSNKPTERMYLELERILARRALKNRPLNKRDILSILAKAPVVADANKGQRGELIAKIQLIAAALAGDNSVDLKDADDVIAAIQRVAKSHGNFYFEHPKLNHKQCEFIERVLTSGGMVMTEGAAGSGKTATIKYATDFFKDQGKRVVATSLAWRATNELASQAKISGMAAAAWLALEKKGELDWDRDTVLVIDEAGQVPADVMEKLITIMRNRGGKIVAIGDRAQLRAIGMASMSLLMGMDGVDSGVRLNETNRAHRKIDREIGTLVSQKKAAEAVELMGDRFLLVKANEKTGISGAQGTLNRAIDEWEKYLRSDKTAKRGFDECVILAGSNAECRALNTAMRDKLREWGKLTGPDIVVTVSTPNGEPHQIALAVGDQIRFFKRNDRLKVYNGSGGRILSIFEKANGDHELTVMIRDDQTGQEHERTFPLSELKDKFSNPDNPGAPLLAHKMAMTISNSQGMTVNGAVIWANSVGLSTDSHQAYVALSRARDWTMMINNFEALQIASQAGQPIVHGQLPERLPEPDIKSMVARMMSRDPPELNAALYFTDPEVTLDDPDRYKKAVVEMEKILQNIDEKAAKEEIVTQRGKITVANFIATPELQADILAHEGQSTNRQLKSVQQAIDNTEAVLQTKKSRRLLAMARAPGIRGWGENQSDQSESASRNGTKAISDVIESIRYIKFADDQIEAADEYVRVDLKHGSKIRFMANKLALTESNEQSVVPSQRLTGLDRIAFDAEALVLLAKGKGWTNISINGEPNFREMVAHQAKEAGLAVRPFERNDAAAGRVKIHMERLADAQARAVLAEEALEALRNAPPPERVVEKRVEIPGPERIVEKRVEVPVDADPLVAVRVIGDGGKYEQIRASEMPGYMQRLALYEAALIEAGVDWKRRAETADKTINSKAVELKLANDEFERVRDQLATANRQTAKLANDLNIEKSRLQAAEQKAIDDANRLADLEKKLADAQRVSQTNGDAWRKMRDERTGLAGVFVKIWDRVGELAGKPNPLSVAEVTDQELSRLEASLIAEIESFKLAREATKTAAPAPAAPPVLVAQPDADPTKNPFKDIKIPDHWTYKTISHRIQENWGRGCNYTAEAVLLCRLVINYPRLRGEFDAEPRSTISGIASSEKYQYHKPSEDFLTDIIAGDLGETAKRAKAAELAQKAAEQAQPPRSSSYDMDI